jgi:hypothetical protein
VGAEGMEAFYPLVFSPAELRMQGNLTQVCIGRKMLRLSRADGRRDV